MQIRHEAPADIPAIRALNEAAFETPAEAKLVDKLRKGSAHVLSLVAEDEGRIVGHILFSPVTIGDGYAAVGLGPMAVLPERQKQGIGSELIERALAELALLGHPAVVVLGHAGYYPKFGFVPTVKLGITCEFDAPPTAFMLKELDPGALRGVRGVARYHRAFAGA